MAEMVTVTYSDLRQNLKTYCDKTINDAQEILITRKNHGNIVLVPEEEWTAIQETLFFLNDENKMKRLIRSEKEYEEGRISSYSSMSELRNELEHNA